MITDDVLDKWIAEEGEILRRVRAGAGAGVAGREQIGKLSGLQVMEAMLAGKLPIANMAKTLDFGAIAVGPGTAIFQGSPTADHLNPMGTVHGGWISTILDSALGTAILTQLPAGVGYTTANLTVRYLKPLTPAVVRVRAYARATALGGREAFAEARLLGPDQLVYAEARAECRAMGPPPVKSYQD